MKENTAIYAAFEDFQIRDSAEPEKNLMRAILFSALDDIKKSGDVYRDARRYLLDDRDYYIYSFASICQHLNLCPRTVRYIAGLVTAREDNSLASEERLAA